MQKHSHTFRFKNPHIGIRIGRSEEIAQPDNPAEPTRTTRLYVASRSWPTILTCIVLLCRFAPGRWWIAERAYPFVLDAQDTPGHSCIILVVDAPEQITGSELFYHLFHDFGRHLQTVHVYGRKKQQKKRLG